MIKKILIEWSYRLDDGIINLNNPKHMLILSEVLKDMKLPTKVILEVMSNLTEDQKFQAKSKDTGRTITYGSKDAMDKAIKAGTAEPLDKKDDKVKGKNLFNKKQDNWEKLDDKSNRVKVGNYTDEQYKEETGEYFDNKKTM